MPSTLKISYPLNWFLMSSTTLYGALNVNLAAAGLKLITELPTELNPSNLTKLLSTKTGDAGDNRIAR